MRDYTYTKKNKAKVAIGAYGVLQKNDPLRVTESEAYYMKDDPSFLAKREQLPEGFPTGVTPSDGSKKHFDLSTLKWKSKHIFSQLQSFRRARLLKILQEMESMGFPIPSGRLEGAVMRDLIAELGRHAGWL